MGGSGVERCALTPVQAVEAVLGSDDVCVQTEETVFLAALHWVGDRDRWEGGGQCQ